MSRAADPLSRISRRGLLTSGALAGFFSATGAVAGGRPRGGVLRLGLDLAPERLDPMRGRDLFTRIAGPGAAFETLLGISAAGALGGELAEAWEASEGGRVWQLTLRADARFHDGRAVTAADAAASLLAQRQGGAGARILARIASVEAPGPRQLRIALHDADAQFPLMLADPALVIAPDGDAAAGIGSGPYRLAEFRPGLGARLVRVAGHWRDGSGAWFDAVTLRSLPDPAAREAALRAGHIDAAPLDPLRPAGPLSRNLRLVEAEGTAKLLGRIPGPLGRDRRWARMLGRVLDRTEADDHPLVPGHPGYHTLPAYRPDPEVAPFMLRHHGIDIRPEAGQLDLRLASGRPSAEWAMAAALAPGGAFADMAAELDVPLTALRQARSQEERLFWLRLVQERMILFTPVFSLGPLRHRMLHSDRLLPPERIGGRLPMDDARIALRWSFA